MNNDFSDLVELIRSIIREELAAGLLDNLTEHFLEGRPMQNMAMIDGKEVFYHCCSEERDVETYEQFQYIGEGHISKIRGFRQTVGDKRPHHFWNNKPAEWNPLDNFEISEHENG